MSKKVLINVHWTIQDGKLEAFKSIVREMVEQARKEPGTLGYEWYMSSDGKSCRLVETYVDADALLAHLKGPALQEGAPKLMAISSVNEGEVYGEPGPKAGEMLKQFGAEIFSYTDGVDR